MTVARARGPVNKGLVVSSPGISTRAAAAGRIRDIV